MFDSVFSDTFLIELLRLRSVSREISSLQQLGLWSWSCPTTCLKNFDAEFLVPRRSGIITDLLDEFDLMSFSPPSLSSKIQIFTWIFQCSLRLPPPLLTYWWVVDNVLRSPCWPCGQIYNPWVKMDDTNWTMSNFNAKITRVLTSGCVHYEIKTNYGFLKKCYQIVASIEQIIRVIGLF